MGKGPVWSETDLQKLAKLYLSDEHHSTFARHFPGRTPESVRRAIFNHKHKWAGTRTRVLLRHTAPPIEAPPTAVVDRSYVRAVLREGGFPWLRPVLAERFYNLEAAPPRGNEFWRAA